MYELWCSRLINLEFDNLDESDLIMISGIS